MMTIKLISIILLSISIKMKNPMSMIIILISMTCIYSTFSFEMINNSWIPMMIIMVMVGGLMILYVFIICLSPNEKKTTASFNAMKMAMILLTAIITMKMKNEKNSETFLMMYNYNWNSISMMILIIISCMIIMMKMIYSKNKTIKSMK